MERLEDSGCAPKYAQETWKFVLRFVGTIGAAIIFITIGIQFVKQAARGSVGESEHHAQHKKDTTLKDAQQKVEDEQAWKHFHNYIVAEVPTNPNPAFCFVCHGNIPHSNAKMTRSILNFHTVFLACETCHFRFDPKERAKYGFRWFGGDENIQAAEERYGTKYDPNTGRVRMELSKTMSKITPYKMWEGKYYMVNLRMDSKEAQDYLMHRTTYTPEQQSAIKSKIHTSIEAKGRECAECHQKNGVLPWKRLGFDEERIRDVTGLNIVGMIEKYQKFYIPAIFKEKKRYSVPLGRMEK